MIPKLSYRTFQMEGIKKNQMCKKCIDILCTFNLYNCLYLAQKKIQFVRSFMLISNCSFYIAHKTILFSSVS